jgi:hypothetical protein
MTVLVATGLDRIERPELELLGAAFLGLLLIFTRDLRLRLVKSERAADSLFAGMASAYVFLVLMPELDSLHELLGGRAYVLVLASFAGIYGVEHAAHVVPRLRGDEGEELLLLWMRSAMLWGYGFLFMLAIPELVEADLWLYFVSLSVGALAVAFKSYEVSEHHPRVYQRYGRWVIATGPLIGVAVDLLGLDLSGLFVDLLTAYVAGFIMLLAFTGAVLDHQRTRYGFFVVGASIYVGVFVARYVFLGSA